MAGTVKGITIEIEGKTSGLVKSLGDVNKSLQQTQKSLKTVNDALKIDPKNIDTLKTKQNLLNQAIEETKKKLELEKQAATDAAKALEEGTITKNQYDTLQAEVAKTSSELKGLEGQAQKTNQQIKDLGGGGNKLKSLEDAIGSVGDKLQSVGKKISDFGSTLTKTVTVGVAGIAAATISAATSVDDALDTIAIKTGATGDELEAMRQTARNMAKEIPTDFDVAAAAVGEVNTRFGYTGEELDNLSTKFVKFATLNQTDVSDAIDQTQKALAAFGKDGKSAGHILDVMNKTAQQTGVKTSTLTSGLVSNAAAFQELGLTMEQSVAIMGKLEKSGADSSTVMTALRKALKQTTKDGKPFKQALQEIQSAIKNGTGEVDGLTYAYDLFGKSGDAVYAALKNGSIDFANMSSAAKDLADSTGSVDNTYKNLEDGSGRLKIAQNNLKDSLSDVGAELLESLTPIIKDFCELLKKFADWWNSLDDSQKKIIITIGLVIGVLGPLTSAIGGVITVIGGAIKGIGGVISAINGAGGLSSVLTATCAGPLAAVVLSITAIVMWIQNWEDICEVFSYAWEKLCEGIEDLINGVKNVWNDLVNSIESGIESILGDINKARDESLAASQEIADSYAGAIAQNKYNHDRYGTAKGATAAQQSSSVSNANTQRSKEVQRQNKANAQSSAQHNISIYVGDSKTAQVVTNGSQRSNATNGGR